MAEQNVTISELTDATLPLLGTDKTIVSRNGTTLNDVTLANLPISTPVQTALDAKQATLVSGTNIKTINGETVLGNGDIVVSGGSALPTLTDFSTTIPLDGNKYSAPVQLTGSLNLTLAPNPIVGAKYMTTFIGDGTSQLNFSNSFTELQGSYSFINSIGVKNYIEILYFDGKALYSISQAVGDVGGVSDTTAPLMQSASVLNATPTIVTISFNEALDQTSNLVISDFSVTGKTISAVSYASSTTVNLTVDAYAFGDVSSVTYTNNNARLRDASGNAVITTTITVANNINNPVVETTQFVDFGNTTMVESVNGGGGFNYNSSAANQLANTSNIKLPLGGLGYFEVQYSAHATGIAMAGLDSTNSNTIFGNFSYCAYPQNGNWTVANNQSPPPNGYTGSSTIPYANGDILRITKTTPTTFVVAVSKDNRATFQEINTWTLPQDQDYFPALLQFNTGTATYTQPRLAGGVAV